METNVIIGYIALFLIVIGLIILLKDKEAKHQK